MEFRQKDTLVASLLDHSFKHRYLVCEILLLAEKASHATIVILERADWGTFCPLETCGVSEKPGIGGGTVSELWT